MTGNTRRITWFALGALVVGLLVGAAMARWEFAGLERTIRILEPIGTIWINAVRMTIMPLVVSMLIVAVASSDSLRSMGRLGGVAMLFFVTTIGVIAVYAGLLAPLLMSGLTIDPESAAALRADATAGSQQVAQSVERMGSFAQQLVALVPPNPFSAAASGAMLPLVFFSIVFGAALSRVEPRLRETTVLFFRGVSEAMIQIIRWVFVAAPIGVLALSIVVGGRLGFDAVRAVGYYIGVFVLLMIGVIVMIYVAAVVIGGVPLRKFAAAVAPAQVIALGSRSSSAAMPAVIDAARSVLMLPPQVVSFVIPTAVAIFRVSAPISFVLGALFLGKLYGVEISAGQIASLAVMSVLLSYSVPPVPSGSLFLMAPLFAGYGIPVEGVAILIAVDAIPDLIKTASITTAHMASAVVVARFTDAGSAPRTEAAAA